MRNQKTSDDKAMEKGINQILKIEPYPQREPEPECKHISDGFNYNENKESIKYILRCELCGIYYEELKN